MNELGLKVNLLEKYRYPYIAVIDRGNVLAEICPECSDEPLELKCTIKNHEVVVYSAGFYYKRGASFVKFDGANFSVEGRGIKFLIYDSYNDDIVDCFRFDPYDTSDFNRSDFISSKTSLEKFVYNHDGVELCTVSFPELPSIDDPNIFEWEKTILNNMNKNPYWLHDIVTGTKEGMYKIWKNKKFPFIKNFNSFDEFYNAFHLPPTYLDNNFVNHFLDCDKPGMHTRNGIRVTLYQPNIQKRAIFLVGNCTMCGNENIDKYTPSSLLQNILNIHIQEKGVTVYNYAYPCGNIFEAQKYMLRVLNSLPVKNGDIVFFQVRNPIWGIKHCDLSLKSARPHHYGEIFTDGHYTQNGNKMIADGIYEFLEKNDFFENISTNTKSCSSHLYGDFNEDGSNDVLLLAEYKKMLKFIYKQQISPKVGAVVMNCNPFTLGHRYLVEKALTYCDKLLIFVVEEENDFISFDDRIKLVKENLSDLKNVIILPSGKFIISMTTFEAYFNKEKIQNIEINPSLDVEIFARKIAPCLNISVRFAGEEPFDNITKQYNETMAKILPQYNIEFIEFPRLMIHDVPVSASKVRALIKKKEFEEIKKLFHTKRLNF